MKLNTTVYFFTDSTDTSFIYNDIVNFSELYHKVQVYTYHSGNADSMPANVSVKVVGFSGYNTKAVVTANFSTVITAVLAELFRYPNYLRHPGIFIKAVSGFLRDLYLAGVLDQDGITVSKDAVFFTFWFNGWSTSLAQLKKKKKIASFFTRIHGTDVFEYRMPVTQRLPFRWFQLKQVDKVFSVSKNGAVYLKEKYPQAESKITVNYLGVKGFQFTEIQPGSVFTIVSCSIMDVIKRVYLIAGVLKHISVPVRWIHIGEKVPTDPTTPLLEKNLEELAKHHKNIQVEFTGFLPNQKVFDLYKSTSVNLFLSLSESEGLPVSMMESIGFGIPVMATDVGGCREIVTDTTGILISKDVDAIATAAKITEFMNSEKNTNAFRKSVHQFCQEHFNRDTNFLSLNKEIQSAQAKSN